MTADLPAAIRQALHDGEIDAADLRQPVLRDRTPRRPPRWTVTVAVAAVVLVIAGLSAVVAGRRHHDAARPAPHRSTAVVPWSPAGVHGYTGDVPYPAEARVPRGTADCANRDFLLVSSRVSTAAQAGGELATMFTLRYTSQVRCALERDMSADLLDAHGAILPNDLFGGHNAVVPPDLVTPGQLILGTVTWFAYRGRTSAPAGIALYPGGRSLAAIRDPRLVISVASVAVPAHPKDYGQTPWRAGVDASVDRVGDDGDAAVLRAAYSGPAKVSLGSILRYRITLTNVGTKAISLRPCPGFVEQLRVVPIKYPTIVGRRGPLNCAQAPATVIAGGAVTFAFELPTAGQIRGPGNLTWQLTTTAGSATQVFAGVTTH